MPPDKIKTPAAVSPDFEQERIDLALASLPNIYPCVHCGHAVLSGFCCGTCGSASPQDLDG